MENSYTYLFIRSDLCLEQKIIQMAHASHLIGLNQADKALIPNAVLIEAKELHGLLDIANYLMYNDIPFEIFFEPDIDEYTAIATYPIKGSIRKKLSHFQTMGTNETNT